MISRWRTFPSGRPVTPAPAVGVIRVLELPSDAERHLPSDLGFDALRGPAVYCLRLERPDDLPAAWDDRFESRPAWFSAFADAAAVVYVGSAMDVLHRLTDHKDGENRLTVLTDICEIARLRNIWFFPGVERDELEREERTSARLLRREKADWYVRQA